MTTENSSDTYYEYFSYNQKNTYEMCVTKGGSDTK